MEKSCQMKLTMKLKKHFWDDLVHLEY
jgi:hypothetical protein